MRALLYVMTVAAVMGLAFWAYRENYRTQAAIDEMNGIQNEIAGLREQLGVLRAEWAYLNRPERLRDLVDLNFERLQLVPVQSGQFVDVDHVDYPKIREFQGPPAPDAFTDPQPGTPTGTPPGTQPGAAAPAAAAPIARPASRPAERETQP